MQTDVVHAGCRWMRRTRAGTDGSFIVAVAPRLLPPGIRRTSACGTSAMARPAVSAGCPVSVRTGPALRPTITT
ncbi:hypothetical protein AB0H17_23845 [Streptomyces olivoreticuli]